MTDLTQTIADLKAGSIELAESLAKFPDLGTVDQLRLALAEQEYRKSQSLPADANRYLSILPWLANSPSALIELILAHLPNELASANLATLQTELDKQIEQIDPAYQSEFKRAYEAWNSKPLETEQLDQIGEEFGDIYTKIDLPKIEHWLLRNPKESRGRLLSRLLPSEVYNLETDWASYPDRFPEYLADIDRAQRQYLGEDIESSISQRKIEGLIPPDSDETSTVTYKHIHQVGDLLNGRFRLDRKLGSGTFGTVFLAYDEAIERIVAIKTVKKDLNPAWGFNPEKQIKEARLCAKLVHPNIVPVLDVGKDKDGDIFIVYQYIDCTTLGNVLKNPEAINDQRIATIVLSIAQALYAADCKEIIHQDIKPANILIERETQVVYVTDFGLAVREDDYIEKSVGAGSPPYKSPEQVRCEGDRIKGRSDLFSLGIVMYEMLTRERPFKGQGIELNEQIKNYDPPNPSTLKLGIPRELDRICMKLLQKDPHARYANGQLVADDLQAWLNSQEEPEPQEPTEPATVQPRGLRSFTESDSDFFLELLPGLRDRHGIPESVSFWTDRIQTRDPAKAFCVGMIMGPSGSGKSSLVKAGIVPLLSNIVAIHLDATPANTESRLFKALQDKLPGLQDTATLSEAMIKIRRSEDPKVVVFIDQFEQWLSANQDNKQSELTAALRQCDGKTLQAVLVVRDDFGSATGFMINNLEIPPEESNFATVRLFDKDHAKKVLIKFGKAYEKLPADPEPLSPSQSAFTDRVITELDACSQDRGVIPVQLALFAEMMKFKPWATSSLDSVGGASGVLGAFLDESFSLLNPQNRIHQSAAQGLLKALLPAVGVDLKGQSKSKQQLMESCGYKDRPADFQSLLEILDRKLRLIKPSEGQEESYQLTHDYLIAPLREWLSRKQRETLRGRSELVLAERAEAWTTRKESKQLPTFLEWLKIRLLTRSRSWTSLQRAMMKRSDVEQLTRMSITGSIAAILLGAGLWWGASRTVDQLKDREFEKLPTLLSQLKGRWDHFLLRPMIDRKLKAISDPPDPKEELKYRLAKLAVDPKDSKNLEELRNLLIKADYSQIAILVDQLESRKSDLINNLWEEAGKKNNETLLQSASALAKYDPADKIKWDTIKEALADRIVEEPSYRVGSWTVALKGAKKPLSEVLEKRFKSKLDASKSYQRNIACDILREYTDTAEELCDLMLEGDPKHFTLLFEKYKNTPSKSDEKLHKVLTDDVPKYDPAVEGSLERRLEEVRRQARAAIAILLLSKDQKKRQIVYDFLKVDDDPENLAQFIHAIPGRVENPTVLFECYEELLQKTLAPPNPDPVTRQQDYLRLYAFVLGLGDFSTSQLPPGKIDEWAKKLREQYASHPSRAVHSSLGWTLRQWGKHDLVKQVDQTEIPIDPSLEREWYIAKATPSISPFNAGSDYDAWTAGDIYLTMLVFKADTQFSKLQTKQLSGAFAISDRETTWGQFRPFNPGKRFRNQFTKIPLNKEDEPVFGPTWLESIKYLNWLSVSSGLPITETSYLDIRYPTKGFELPFLYETKNHPIKRGKRGFRLPSKIEWIYAARSGVETAYPFGSDASLSDQYAWSRGNSETSSHHSVCKLRPNLGGLFDVNGNLAEWVQDYNGAHDEPEFIIFGGSFENITVRIEREWKLCQDEKMNDIGFRIVQSIDN
jgi:serine/threonine protein kinase